MNERIKELAEQATQKFSRFGERDSWEKLFAELIVGECISTVENLSPGYQDYRNQIEDAFRRDCVEQIKQHFGVEEPEDSACPLCGEDGGTTCGMPGCQY